MECEGGVERVKDGEREKHRLRAMRMEVLWGERCIGLGL